MNIRIMLAAAVAIGGLSVSQAYAGSPYYANEAMASGSDYSTGTSSEAASVAEAPATRGATSAPAGTSPLGADGYLPVEKTSPMFNHAEGTMGTP